MCGRSCPACLKAHETLTADLNDPRLQNPLSTNNTNLNFINLLISIGMTSLNCSKCLRYFSRLPRSLGAISGVILSHIICPKLIVIVQGRQDLIMWSAFIWVEYVGDVKYYKTYSTNTFSAVPPV